MKTRFADEMYAIACEGGFSCLPRHRDAIRWLFRVFCGLNIIIKAPGQFRGLRVSLWSNALWVSPDEDSEIIVYFPTSTFKLKLCMVQSKIFFAYNFFKHEQDFAMIFI